MAKQNLRIERLQQLIRRDVAEMLTTGLRDPRLRLASVTQVKLASDLRHATVLVSCLGSEADKRTFMRGLESARGRIQAVIAKHLRTRVTPRLAFHYDDGIERSVRVARVIAEARAQDRAAQLARGEVEAPAGGEPPAAESAESAASAENVWSGERADGAENAADADALRDLEDIGDDVIEDTGDDEGLDDEGIDDDGLEEEGLDEEGLEDEAIDDEDA